LQPTAAELQLGAQALVKPHPWLACCVGDGGRCYEECRTALERVQHPSSTKRPIDIPSMEMKMVERALVFRDRALLGPALMPQQTGVSVAGGITMLTAATEAELRQGGPDFRKLDEDLKNCFGEMCRTGLQEDLLDSKELLGEDLSHLAPYVHMAYGGLARYGGWFWLEATASEPARWAFVHSAEGVRQGAPLSCLLCGVGTKRAQLAGEAALDRQHGVERYAGSTEMERAASFERAAEAGGVGGYLDDNALKGQLHALPHGHAAYHLACAQRNGTTVPKKSVLSGPWYSAVGSAGVAVGAAAGK
jgi:hypothetical protein